MKKTLHKVSMVAIALLASVTVNAQCPTITCPGDITVNNDSGTCGAVVNYTTPVGVDLCSSGGGNVLFVVDGVAGTAAEIPTVLTAAGYAVTSVFNDFVSGNNITLQGTLSQYDVIFWHASGSNGAGGAHNAATFSNLSNYVTNGGAVFVTGYDVIASPNDPELIAFLGGTTSSDGGFDGTETVVGSNSLTTGVTNIVGLALTTTGDHDGLNGLQPGTVGVATTGTSHGWTIKTLGAGEIALVSSTNSGTSAFSAWSTPGSGYNEALLNFSSNHTCTNSQNVLVVVDGGTGTATEIPAELTAAGYTVTTVFSDYAGGDNATLQGTISQYDVIFWHASGTGVGGAHNAATFVNLSNYVTNGGAVFVTGYDVIASPNDPELIAFLGGTTSSDGGFDGTETVVGSNSLTTGVTNIVGLALTTTGDHDGLNGLQPGTVGVATTGTSHGWTIKTLGAGEIALVSSTNSGTSAFPAWSTPGSGYNEALLNFSFNHASCGSVIVGSPVTTMSTGLADGATFPLGATIVTYEVVDGQGNNLQSCSFVVTVVDNEAPVADVASLTDVTAECEVTSLTAPTATDNCTALVTVTNNATLPISASGTTVVTWSYDDGNGNVSTQDQNVVIADATAPVADVATLADVTAECEVTSLTAPTATDNCTASVTVTNNATLPISASGTTVVTWSYDDGNGNVLTQDQNVVIADVTAPVADIATLADETGTCDITPATPTATDNCSGSIDGVSNVTFPISTVGTTVVTWTYDDGNGNVFTQDQNVTVSGVNTGVTESGATLTADATGVTYQWLDCDNAYAPIAGEMNASFTATALVGNYAVEINDNGCVDTSACFLIDFTGLEDLASAGISIYPNPSTGLFTIESVQSLETVQILDVKGRLVYETAGLNNSSLEVNISNENAGVYYVRISGSFGTIVEKVVLH